MSSPTDQWSPTLVNTGAWQSICYGSIEPGNGLFVAVGDTNKLITSSDGKTWTATTTPLLDGVSCNWKSICYGTFSTDTTTTITRAFVGVSSNTAILYGELIEDTKNNNKAMIKDGWSVYSSGVPTTSWSSVCYGDVNGGLFVAVKFSSVMYSVNGKTWSLVSAPGVMWTSVCFGKVQVNNADVPLFVAVGSSGSRVMTSNDGINWASLDTIPTNMQRGWASVCYGNNLYVAVSSNSTGNYAMTSVNGSEWTVQETNIGRAVCYGIVNGNGLYVALPSYVAPPTAPNPIKTSTDGKTWSTASNPNTGAIWASVCGGDGMFAAVASNTTGPNSSGTTRLITIGTVSCYYKTSEIICFIDNEEKHICIKDIKINYLVKTYKHGYKKVSLIGKKSCFIYPNNQDTNCLYKIKNGSLILSGGHYLLVDELPNNLTHQFYLQNIMIDDKKILLTCDSDNFEKINETIYTELYHLVLESDSDEQQYGIYANNVLTESCSKKHFISTGFY
jgi:hypothetical protein